VFLFAEFGVFVCMPMTGISMYLGLFSAFAIGPFTSFHFFFSHLFCVLFFLLCCLF
jgi:hypothetical protein